MSSAGWVAEGRVAEGCWKAFERSRGCVYGCRLFMTFCRNTNPVRCAKPPQVCFMGLSGLAPLPGAPCSRHDAWCCGPCTIFEREADTSGDGSKVLRCSMGTPVCCTYEHREADGLVRDLVRTGCGAAACGTYEHVRGELLRISVGCNPYSAPRTLVERHWTPQPRVAPRGEELV